MFSELNLRPSYSTYENDVGKEFYSPVLANSVRYDRAAAYFSAKALANYSQGLETFARKGYKYRLLISNQISEEEYAAIKDGYDIRKRISAEMCESLRENLTLQEKAELSNLAYLISIDTIDIKIAFTKNGIFHDKFGIVEDDVGNIISFRGSNNETEAAFANNYESFDITCSWLASDFDKIKIEKSKSTFEKLWNNEVEGMFVCLADSVILDAIAEYNRGIVIVDPVLMQDDCAILDYDGGLHLINSLQNDVLTKGPFYQLRLKRYIDSVNSSAFDIRFHTKYRYPTYKKIIDLLENDSSKRDYRFMTTQRLEDYIAEREMYIQERAHTGLSIKAQAPEVLERYERYKAVVDAAMVRKLRDKQMWDSFFMCAMRKAGNFSVPGSGKTSSVLGMYAYLNAKCNVDKIVMIGPKNAFDSWMIEFTACFGDKKPLKVFSIQDETLHTPKEKELKLLYESANCNLFLFNYESLGTYLDVIRKLIDNHTLLVFDEVHKIKARDGLRASHALEISENAYYTIALTGTPIPNTYLDIRNLLDILYRDEYDEFFGFADEMLRNPTVGDVEAINAKLQPFFCRTTKHQLNVPDPSEDIIRSVKATEAENRLFQILTMKYRKNFLVLVIRLLQLESNPNLLLENVNIGEYSDILDISGDLDDYDFADFSSEVKELIKGIGQTTKFKKCIEAAKSLYTQHKPMIIWCIFVDSIEKIARELKSCGMHVAVIYGNTSQDERTWLLDAFRAGKFDVLITNPHTLAESVSLHTICHDAIYYEYSYNLVHLLQSKDRIHRLGLPDGQYTQYYFIQDVFTTVDNIEYSLDGAIYDRLKQKEQTMLNAIENDVLENGTTPEEELKLIFAPLKL